MSDMLLSFFTTLGAALGARAWDEDPPRFTVPALGACLGLGFLAKGPIALVVVGAALVALAIAHRRGPTVSGGSVAAAVLAFAVTGLGWFAALLARLGPGALEHFFLRENLSRFADSTYALGQPPWFYLTAYLGGGLPWSLFLPLALWRARAETDPRARASVRALLLWAVLVLLPLTLSRGKIDYYLLPLYPAASLIVGRHFAAVSWRRLDRSWASVVLLLAATALAAAALRPPRVPEPWLPGPAARGLLLVVLAAGAVATALAARRPSARVTAIALAGSRLRPCRLVLSAFFLPAFARAQPGPLLVAAVTRERALRPDLAVAVCSDPARVRRDLLFHARIPVLSRCNLAERAASAAPHLLLASPEEEVLLRAVPGLRRIASYRYLPAAITPRLAPPRPGAGRARPPRELPGGERRRRALRPPRQSDARAISASYSPKPRPQPKTADAPRVARDAPQDAEGQVEPEDRQVELRAEVGEVGLGADRRAPGADERQPGGRRPPCRGSPPRPRAPARRSPG